MVHTKKYVVGIILGILMFFACPVFYVVEIGRTFMHLLTTDVEPQAWEPILANVSKNVQLIGLPVSVVGLVVILFSHYRLRKAKNRKD